MPTVPLLASVADLSASQIAGAASQLVPSGVVMPYAGTSAPSGWLFCGGEAISRTTYANLFSAVSTTYGTGDGSTTFKLPDLRGRIAAGKDYLVNSANANRITSGGSGITSTTLGANGGTETHTLTTAQLATHSHANTLSDPGHSHTSSASRGNIGSAFSCASPGSIQFAYDQGTNSSSTGISISNANAGSGTAHQNTQPTLILNYIIKI